VKCPQYRPLKDRSCDFFSCMRRDDCYHGWLPFWTPAERAGLKAMGRTRKSYEQIHNHNAMAIVAGAIGIWVSAARKAKEWAK